MHQSTPEIKPVQNTYHMWGDNYGTEFIGNKQTLKNTQLYILVHIYMSVFFMFSREAAKVAVLFNFSLFFLITSEACTLCYLSSPVDGSRSI